MPATLAYSLDGEDQVPGFIIAVMMCAGTNCEMSQPEPERSYATYEACTSALATKATALEAYLKQHPAGSRQSSIVCLSQNATIVEVEQPFEVIDTAIVHAAPSANSTYVGIVEQGGRTLVTGLVSGTRWLRVLLKDGKSGFVFADRLRKIGGDEPLAAALPPALTPPALRPAAPLQSAIPLAARAPTAAVPEAAARSMPPASSDCENCPSMQPLPAGVLAMGSNDDPTEKPIHKVAIPAFALAKHELTAAEWTTCATAGACSYKPPAVDGDPRRMAMTNLSFDDAVEYVAWLRKQTGRPYRLPSEAEWEYAARAGANTRYPWGDKVGFGQADCAGCGGAHDDRAPQPVDTFAPNRSGLAGMTGGVAEWVEDCWHVSYKGAPANGSPWSAPNCMHHVLRGGSWKNGPQDITVSSRNYYDTSVRYPANGMRVALSGK